MSKRISASIPDELYKLMKKVAEDKDMSISAFTKHCITVYITAYAKKLQRDDRK